MTDYLMIISRCVNALIQEDDGVKKIVSYVLGVGVLVGLIVWGGRYYDSRYRVSDTFYVLVPDDIGIELEELKDVDGKVVDTGKEYVFVGYNSSGVSRELAFTYSTNDVNDLLEPGVYLEVDVSDTIVVEHRVVDRDVVPDEVLDLIEK